MVSNLLLSSTRCGLIACRYLAHAYRQGTYVPAPEIAAYYRMNVRTLMPALRQMTRSGILRSRVGGKEPGFILARDPKDISLGEVFSSLEGTAEIPCCKELLADINCDCEEHGACSMYQLFNDMLVQAKARIAGVSLEEHAKGSGSPI